MRRALVLASGLLLAPAAHAGETAEACAAASEAGQLLRMQARLKDARAQFMTCVKDECPGVVKKDCARFLADLDEAQPSIVLGARDQAGDLVDVRVSFDDVRVTTRLDGKALTVDPGEHRLRFEADGHVPAELTVVIRIGERNRLVSVVLPVAAAATPPAPPPPPRDRRSPAFALVMGGVGVAALGTFAAFGLAARNDVQRLRDHCGTHCTDDEVSPARRKALIADVSLGVALVSLSLSTWAFVRLGDEPARVGAAVVPGGGFLALDRAF